MTHHDYAAVYFYSICDETFAPIYFFWRKSFSAGVGGGGLLGDVSSAAISRCAATRKKGETCASAPVRWNARAKVCAPLPHFNFSNELLPWQRLQCGGGGVMATD